METFAFAAWRGGDTRVANQASFVDTLSVMRAEDSWEQFRQDNGSDITNLAMNFYLKNSEFERRGFEFTHKSFGDYLAARALLSAAKIVMELGFRRIDTAGTEWLKVTSGGAISREIADFLRNELKLEILRGSEEACEQIKSFFADLAGLAIREGLSVQLVPSRSFRAAERLHNNAELAIWTVMNAAALALGEKDVKKASIQVLWGGNSNFSRLIERHSGKYVQDELHSPTEDRALLLDMSSPHRARGDNFSLRDCLAHLQAPGVDLFEAYLHGADLRYADLTSSFLGGVHLCSADVRFCNFSKARFSRAHLDHVDFTESVTDGATFIDARIGQTRFTPSQQGKLVLSLLSVCDDRVLLDLTALDLQLTGSVVKTGLKKYWPTFRDVLARLIDGASKPKPTKARPG